MHLQDLLLMPYVQINLSIKQFYAQHNHPLE
nr:MAG TPA: hypothetical protein [Caudoviricetes sp.]